MKRRLNAIVAVQSQVRSPIRSHPAIHAQNTGSNAATALSAQTTGTISPDEQQKGLEGEISSAKTGEEGISIEPDLYVPSLFDHGQGAYDQCDLEPRSRNSKNAPDIAGSRISSGSSSSTRWMPSRSPLRTIS